MIAFDFLLFFWKRCEAWNDKYANSECEPRESFNYFHFSGIPIARVLDWSSLLITRTKSCSPAPSKPNTPTDFRLPCHGGSKNRDSTSEFCCSTYYCYIKTFSLALIGVSFALLRNLAFRRWWRLPIFRTFCILARLTPKNLLGRQIFVLLPAFFETGKLCSLRACCSHSADSVEEKSDSEWVHATLSNVWSLRKSVRRATPVSLIFF